jgi:hypoxanthine phosphoribosyltransferase
LKTILSETEIAAAVNRVAGEINHAYRGKDPVICVCVLKGAFLFFADLCRMLDCSREMYFLRVSSYGTDRDSSGNTYVSYMEGLPVKGRDVLIVDDICDSGRTLDRLRELIFDHGAASVRSVVLIDKPDRREVEIEPDFSGVQLQNVGFLYGYGMDLDGMNRQIPHINEE